MQTNIFAKRIFCNYTICSYLSENIPIVIGFKLFLFSELVQILTNAI